MLTRPRRSPRAVLRDLGRSFPGRDLSLWAAGATFFGMIGIVPLTLLALWLTTVLVGPAVVDTGVAALLSGLPGGHGTPAAVRALTAAAQHLPWTAAVVLLLPAGLYGEGLRRAFLQMSPGEADVLTGWRGRVGVLPLAVVAPALLVVLLVSAPSIAPLYAAGGGRLLFGIVIGFHVLWVLVSTTTLLAYRFVAAGPVGARALVLGAFSTGAVLAGFLHGFLLFLAIPVQWSLPFGGLPVIGAVAALGLWLYLLHVLVLLGYRLTLVLDAARPAERAPGAAPVHP